VSIREEAEKNRGRSREEAEKAKYVAHGYKRLCAFTSGFMQAGRLLKSG